MGNKTIVVTKNFVWEYNCLAIKYANAMYALQGISELKERPMGHGDYKKALEMAINWADNVRENNK